VKVLTGSIRLFEGKLANRLRNQGPRVVIRRHNSIVLGGHHIQAVAGWIAEPQDLAAPGDAAVRVAGRTYFNHGRCGFDPIPAGPAQVRIGANDYHSAAFTDYGTSIMDC
jgi:hypothetical protein